MLKRIINYGKAEVLLFIIGLIVILNKKIKKNTKVLTVAILSITITALLLLAKFVL